MAFDSRQHKERIQKEEYAIVLDIIIGSAQSFKDDEVAQAIGTTNFQLLELVPKTGVILKTAQKVYIGDGKREEIQYIKKTITIDKLSPAAHSELQYALEEIIMDREEEFVKFFNMAGPITIRKHSLELVPGIGKKHLKNLMEEREIKQFESFKDISQRCHFLAEPEKAITQRIITELEDEEEFRIFVRK